MEANCSAPLLSCLDAEQDLTCAGLHRPRGNILARYLDDPGHLIERETVLTQTLTRDLDVRHIIGYA